MIPSALRGYNYPTLFERRCTRYHPCRATHKCQNYNPNLRECFLCEQRVHPQVNLGGYLAEGKYTQDLQLAIKVLEDFMKMGAYGFDKVGTKMQSSATVADEYNDLEKVMGLLDSFKVTEQ